MAESGQDQPIQIITTDNPLETTRDPLVLRERVSQTLDILGEELSGIVSPQEAQLRIEDIRKRIVFADQKRFEGFYYEQYHGEWDKTTQAFVYEPRRDYGRETEKLIIILESDLVSTPEVIQMVAHEGIHFCGLPTTVERINPMEIEEITPAEYYHVSTTIIGEWLGPLFTKLKDSYYLECSKKNIETEVKSGASPRTYDIIETNAPSESIDEEIGLWESVTDWLALTTTRKANPDYEPKTGYIGRRIIEKYFEISKEQEVNADFTRALKEALFLGQRDGIEKVLTQLGKTYSSFKEEVNG